MRISGTIPVRSADTRNGLSIMMIKKSLDTMKQSSEAMKNIMEQSVKPNLGSKINIKI